MVSSRGTVGIWKLCMLLRISCRRPPASLFLFLQVLLLFPAHCFVLLSLIALNKVLRYRAPSYRKEKNELRVSLEQCQFFFQVNLSVSLETHGMKQLSLNIFRSV